MDIFRTLLCLGLFTLLWNVRVRGSRPLRDFVAWGMLYPFHFVLMVLMILVIWGVIGSDFGLQGLFLEDNALTQILLGAAVMLLFSALILHFSVFDPPDYWWKTSLKSLISVLRDPDRVISSGSPLQHLLNNGFLERLRRADMVAIAGSIARRPDDDLSRSPGADAVRLELDGLLNQEPLRLLVSPAVLLAKGFMLVFLVGVVTSIVIPILNKQPVEIAERLPWLVGVILGQLLGIVLACRTTRWVCVSAGWRPIADRALLLIQQLSDSDARRADENEALDLKTGKSPAWMNLLLAFFLIHLVVNVVLPDRVTSRWIDWPERTYSLFHKSQAAIL